MADQNLDTHAPSRLKAAADWAILATGVLSLAFAVLATTTGLVSADDSIETASSAAPDIEQM